MCLCVIINVLVFVQLSTSAERSGDFDYTVLDDNTIEINRYIGHDNELEIPSVINGKIVISIGEYAFSDCSSLKSVIIPDSVKNISAYAFYSSKHLEKITIPNSVISIGNCAFQYCSSLANITIENGVTSIGHWVFDDTAIYNDESNWENGVLYIGNYLIDTNSNLPQKYTI